MKNAIFSAKEHAKVLATLDALFSASVKDGESWSIEGDAKDERLYLTLELADAEREKVSRFESAYVVSSEDEQDSLVEARITSVEFLCGWLTEWFRDGRWPRPHLDWKTYDFGGKEIYFRGQVFNERLEKMADEWLARAESQDRSPD